MILRWLQARFPHRRFEGLVEEATPEEDARIIQLRDHRWVEVGSIDWCHEVMEAINEVIVRVAALEDGREPPT